MHRGDVVNSCDMFLHVFMHLCAFMPVLSRQSGLQKSTTLAEREAGCDFLENFHRFLVFDPSPGGGGWQPELCGQELCGHFDFAESLGTEIKTFLGTFCCFFGKRGHFRSFFPTSFGQWIGRN